MKKAKDPFDIEYTSWRASVRPLTNAKLVSIMKHMGIPNRAVMVHMALDLFVKQYTDDNSN